jgi:UDP:flavonoid glycosyltransferase YjiC (YdhE family)
MAKIIWYVTNHGLGHATRTMAIARELFKKKSDLKITFVTSGIAKEFTKNSLRKFEDRISFKESYCDIGLKLKSFDEPDIDEMKKELENYIENSKYAIESEAKDLKVHELLISDVVPHAFEIAKKMNIPSVLLSNFTWYEIYRGILPNISEVEILNEMYSKATYTIQLAGYAEKNYGKIFKRGLYSRIPDVFEANRIRENILYMKYEKIIYMGLGMSTQIENALKETIGKNIQYAFIVPSTFPKKHSNMFVIPKNYMESQNYVSAADICVIKSGWSTVSECIIMNKPTIIVKRKNIPEDVNTQGFLEKNYKVKAIPIEDLKNVDLEMIERPYKKESNDERIITVLIELMEAQNESH